MAGGKGWIDFLSGVHPVFPFVKTEAEWQCRKIDTLPFWRLPSRFYFATVCLSTKVSLLDFTLSLGKGLKIRAALRLN
jgi:hypothetical protein